MLWKVLLFTTLALNAIVRTDAVLGDSKKVIFPLPHSAGNYARMDASLPQELTSFTLCVHMRSDLNSKYQMGVVSYAVPENHNELLLFVDKGFNLYMFEYVLMADPPSPWDGGWHAICTTWRSSDGAWQFYVDGALTATGSGFKVGGSVRTGGAWILGQDQDNVGGGFQAYQAFIGELSQVNLWDRVLSPDEIATECNHGNVIDWDTTNIEVFGQASTDEYLQCENPCTADIVLVLDLSWSIPRDQFVLARNFMRSLTECAALQDQDIRIGVILNTCVPWTYVALGQYVLESPQLREAIDYMMYEGGLTRTGLAIRYMRITSDFRDGVRRAAVILTDGQTSGDYAYEAEVARAAGVDLYGVTVGYTALIDSAVLDTISNGNNRVFGVDQACEVAQKIVDDLCE